MRGYAMSEEQNYTLDIVKKDEIKIDEIKEYALDNNNMTMPALCEKEYFNIFYISDIHLEHRFINKFGTADISDKSARKYIKKLIDEMFKKHNIPCNKTDSFLKTYSWYGFEGIERNILIVAGDVASTVKLVKIFFEELKRQYIGKIVYVLGNHEYWDLDDENNMAILRKSLEQEEIFLLENDLLLFYVNHFSKLFFIEDIEIVRNEDLYKLENDEIKEKIHDSCLAIYGGTGFAYFNEEFNSVNGNIYRNGITDIEDEKERTLKFLNGYNRLLDIAKNEPIIILSHMPKEDWSGNVEYNSNWTYFYGHTHSNCFIRNKEMTIIADNQIGYEKKYLELKSICFSPKKDIFAEYEDGIYEIDRDAYYLFLRCMYISCQSYRDRQITMLKRDGKYLFLTRGKSGKLQLLDGFHVKDLEIQDINYYYDNMSEYCNLLINATTPFLEYMYEVSLKIKQVGGTGVIHGSIIDIDFFNHVYVNPLDGKIVAYFATSPDDKYIYPSIPALLKEECPDKYKLFQKNKREFNEISAFQDTELMIGTQYDDCRDYLKASNQMKKIEYLSNNIIRIWMQEWYDKYSDASKKYRLKEKKQTQSTEKFISEKK